MTNSLGIDKPPARTRVVVAMSGGVDSSVVAALLTEEGYDVVGLTLQLYDHGAAAARPNACCAGRDIHDARQVADALSIPHYVLDYESRFRAEVIDAFAESYIKGETPVPCIECNRTVKFRDLLATARDLGADTLATGHYARRAVGPGGPELHRAAESAKDQSYFLFTMTRAQLAYLRFPLGGMPKAETRAAARHLGLPVAEKPDSQDICFVPTGGYAGLVARLRPEGQEPGEIVDRSGVVLGHHEGIINFTVGQRRGLDLGASTGTDPLYVLRIEPGARRIVVGPHSALARQHLVLERINWLGDRPLDPAGEDVTVKIRSTQAPVPARIRARPGGGADVELAAPEFGVSPGQACVVHTGARVLGGGWIARGPAAEA
jgi:tRNA-specific 2-thiouridylase